MSFLQGDARLVTDRNSWVFLPGAKLEDIALKDEETLCGTIYDLASNHHQSHVSVIPAGQNVFIIGDVAQVSRSLFSQLSADKSTANDNTAVLAAQGLCNNYETALPHANVVGLGHLPIVVHGVGVLYKKTRILSKDPIQACLPSTGLFQQIVGFFLQALHIPSLIRPLQLTVVSRPW